MRFRLNDFIDRSVSGTTAGGASFWVVSAIGAGLALVLAGCSLAFQAEDPTMVAAPDSVNLGANAVVDVSLDDLRVVPSTFIVRPGTTVTFNVTNDGAIFHELRFTNATGIEEHLTEAHATPEANHDDVDEAANDAHDEEEYHDLVLELKPGESATITVDFPDDTSIYTEAACLVPGHYEAGMTAEILYA